MKTQVAIIGSGPSGLLLSRMLYNRGIESVILENRNESYLRSKIRAGILDNSTLSILQLEGVGKDAEENSLTHDSLTLSIAHKEKTIKLKTFHEKPRHLYRQTNLIAHLIDRSKEDSLRIIWEAKGQRLEGLTEKETTIHYSLHGKLYTMQSDYVVGCDGWMGICRPTVETFQGREKTHAKFYPFSWYGGLVEEDNTSSWSVVYKLTEEGFAFMFPSTKKTSRMYLQCKNGIDPDTWTEEEMTLQLERRLGKTVKRIIKREVHTQSLKYTENLRYGNLFLAGDAAHFLPLTFGKGLNLAVAEVKRLADAFHEKYKNSDAGPLDHYERKCLDENQKTIKFIDEYTELIHKNLEQTEDHNRQRMNTLQKIFDSENHLKEFVRLYAS